MKAYILVACLALGACATVPKAPEPYAAPPVMVPVPVACRPVLSTPVYPDTDAALAEAPNSVAWAKLIVKGRAVRIAREAELLAALVACSGTDPAAPAGAGAPRP